MGKDDSDSYSVVIGAAAVGMGANTTVIGTSGTTADCYLYGETLYMEDDQVIYNPQATFTGTLIIGDGGGSLSYGAGTDGYYNTIMGVGTAASLTTGDSNVIIGRSAAPSATTSARNVIIGDLAMFSSIAGALNNVAIGQHCMYLNAGGDSNVAIGHNCADAYTSYTNCVIIGGGSDTAGLDSYSIVIGSNAVGQGSNTTVLGTSGTTTDTYLYGILHPDAVIRLKQAAAASSSNVLTLDFSAASTYTVTLTENVTTLTVTNAAAGDKVMILFTQDVGGTHTVAFPGGWIWPAGAVPTITAAGGSKDCVTVYYDGTNYWADFSQNFS
jgi:hypothetical protein